MNRRTREVLPIPASPVNHTSRGSPLRTRCISALSSANSSARPTNGSSIGMPHSGRNASSAGSGLLLITSRDTRPSELSPVAGG